METLASLRRGVHRWVFSGIGVALGISGLHQGNLEWLGCIRARGYLYTVMVWLTKGPANFLWLFPIGANGSFAQVTNSILKRTEVSSAVRYGPFAVRSAALQSCLGSRRGCVSSFIARQRISALHGASVSG